MNPTRALRSTCIIAVALLALSLKLAIAYNTIVTSDAVVVHGLAKALLPQPSFPHGFRLSRTHRSGDGVAVGLRRLDVSPESTGTRGIIFCAQLSDQNRAAAFFASVCLLLAFPKSKPQVLDHGSDHDLFSLVGAVAKFSGSVREKRARLRKLLGNLGHHLFISPDWSD